MKVTSEKEVGASNLVILIPFHNEYVAASPLKELTQIITIS
jgi:hypothetical protein